MKPFSENAIEYEKFPLSLIFYFANELNIKALSNRLFPNLFYVHSTPTN